MIDQDISPNHRTYSPRRRYLAWRAGTAVFVGLALAVSAKAAVDGFESITSELAPVSRDGEPSTQTTKVQPAILGQAEAVDGLQPSDKVVVPATKDPGFESTTTTQA